MDDPQAITSSAGPSTSNRRPVEPPKQFRVLTVGRGGVGKTTIVRSICKTAEGEVPYVNGEKDSGDKVMPTAGRGEHSIEDEITYESNSGYVFHDSRGLETNSTTEPEIIRSFVGDRAASGNFNKQVHVLWACFSAGDDRPLQREELKLLEMRHVPIIVVITKCEGLHSKAVGLLREQGYSLSEARQRAPEEAQKLLHERFMEPLERAGHPIDRIVKLEHMNEEGATCDKLIQATESALDEDTIAQLFLLVQRNNVDLSVDAAIRRTIKKYSIRPRSRNVLGDSKKVRYVLGWFPHCWAYDAADYAADFAFFAADFAAAAADAFYFFAAFYYYVDKSMATAGALAFSKFDDVVILAALVMVAKASFFWRELNQQISRHEAFKTALRAMEVSGVLDELKQAVQDTFPLLSVGQILGLTPKDAEKVIGIVKGYDIVVTEAAIKFERRT